MKRKFCLVFAVLIIALSVAPYSFSEPVVLSDAQMSEVEGEVLFMAPIPYYNWISGHVSGVLADVGWGLAVIFTGGSLDVVDLVMQCTEPFYHYYICGQKSGWQWTKLYSATNKSWGVTWWHVRIHDVPYI